MADLSKKGNREKGSVSNSPGAAGKDYDSNVHSDGAFAKKGRKSAESVSDKGTDRAEASSNVEFAKGGTTKMFGEQEAGAADSAQTGKDDDKGPGSEFASGGKTKMFGFQGSVPARDGITSAR